LVVVGDCWLLLVAVGKCWLQVIKKPLTLINKGLTHVPSTVGCVGSFN